MKVQAVAEVLPSPDGKWAVWTQTRPVMEGEKSEMLTHVYMARSDGSDRVQLTRGEKSATAPRWSPDSRSVFFMSERDSKPNVFRIAVGGGEADRLTDWKGTLASFEPSPDGKWIAFTGAEANPEQEKSKREKTDFRVIDESPANHSLWLTPVDLDIEGKRPVRNLASGPYHISGVAWSPDSRRIAFETRPAPDADVSRRADLQEVDVESGKVRSIAATPATESQPRYSRDGRYLAYTRTVESPGRLNGSRIVLLSRDTGQARELPATPDELTILLDWAPDSKSIYFVEPRGTKIVLYTMPIDGPARVIYRAEKGTIAPGARLNATGTHAGFARQSSDEPLEAFVLAFSGGNPVRISAANTSLPKPPLGETRVVQWKGKDGHAVEGLLTLPVGYTSGKRYPMVLNIHGGPSGAFDETFIGAAGLYPIAAFASKGFAVLRPNPRGSTGYGRDFRSANVNDWGGGDYNDLMTGVDSVIAQGIADPNRLAVMGWSYGGYMTNWVITQTTRFKAAATGAGLSNMPSMWGTNDIPTLLEDYFTGPWFEQTDRYLKLSPLYHVKNVTTPTLILHGEQDVRVPTSQGYEMYNALKRRGVETQMVVYPRTPHGPREPKFMLDIMQRHLDWVEKHL